MENKIGICLFESYHGRKEIGSSRIRGRWIAKNWKDAEIFQMGQEYSTVIYQKVYWINHAKEFKGVKIFDICDPDFLHWGYQTIEMIEEVDAITTSTEALAEIFREFTNKPVVCIPDRVDLTEFGKKKKHIGQAKLVGWFGYSNNFEMLRPVLPFLKKYNLDLLVISDGGFSAGTGFDDIKITNISFNKNTFIDDILTCDIIVNPQSSKGKWKFKSNNKTIQAWALGLPVASNIEELKMFLKEDERRKESIKRLKEVEEKWDVKKSIEEIESLIKQIK